MCNLLADFPFRFLNSGITNRGVLSLQVDHRQLGDYLISDYEESTGDCTQPQDTDDFSYPGYYEYSYTTFYEGLLCTI
jgi:hypothetical protein